MPEGIWNFCIVENSIIQSFNLIWQEIEQFLLMNHLGENILSNHMLHFYVN